MEQSGVDLLESCSFLANTKISGLFSKLAAMAKKPTIECGLSQALDEFLEKLNEYDKYLEHGIFNLNFAEAALVLQNSTDIYSKKVDLLWDIIFDFQKRVLLVDEQNADKDQEIKKLEERKRKYKRKRKTKETEQKTSKLVNSFSFGAFEYIDYLNAAVKPHDFLNELEKFIISPSLNPDINNITLNSNRHSQFLPATKVHSADGEYIGRFDQFHSASIIGKMFQLEKEPDKRHIIKTTTIENPVTRDILLENSLSICVRAGFSQSQDHLLENFTHEKSFCKESFVFLERLPFTLVQKKLRTLSVSDSLIDDDNFSSISEGCFTPMKVDHNENHVREDCDTVGGSIEKRNKSCSQDSAFYELDDEDMMSVDGIETSLSQSSIINKQLCCGGSTVIPKQRLVKRTSIIASLTTEELMEEKAKKRKVAKKKNSEKRLQKLATGITVGLKKFEKFFRQQYKPAENEGEILAESDSSDDEEDREESSDDEIPISSPTPLETNLEDDALTPLESENIESSVLPPPEEPTSSFIPADFVESRKTVHDWRNFILPKLKHMENKSDFDIHEYGSKIMKESEVGEERVFGSIVRGKGAAEVARYFLATLQLANTNNVAIVDAVPGKLANDTFKVKTLDKTRYHEFLDDYQAPSEETFRDRLEKAKLMNPKVPLHSTPSTSAKKIKLTAHSKKEVILKRKNLGISVLIV